MKKVLKTVMLAVLAVAMVFGGMALLNASANTSTNCGNVAIRDDWGLSGTMTCSLNRVNDRNNINVATANTTVNISGQIRVHVYYMQQPNGVPVTAAMNPNANVNSGWIAARSVSRVASNGTAGRNQQVQALHGFRIRDGVGVQTRHTILNR